MASTFNFHRCLQRFVRRFSNVWLSPSGRQVGGRGSGDASGARLLLGFVAARCSTAGMAVSAIASGTNPLRHFFASTAAQEVISARGFGMHSRAGGCLCGRPPQVTPHRFVHRNTDCQHRRDRVVCHSGLNVHATPTPSSHVYRDTAE